MLCRACRQNRRAPSSGSTTVSGHRHQPVSQRRRQNVTFFIATSLHRPGQCQTQQHNHLDQYRISHARYLLFSAPLVLRGAVGSADWGSVPRTCAESAVPGVSGIEPPISWRKARRPAHPPPLKSQRPTGRRGPTSGLRAPKWDAAVYGTTAQNPLCRAGELPHTCPAVCAPIWNDFRFPRQRASPALAPPPGELSACRLRGCPLWDTAVPAPAVHRAAFSSCQPQQTP